LKRVLSLTALAALAGCTVGPDYEAPKTAETLPPAFARALPAEPGGDQVDLARWWTAYGDPELDRLVTAALAENLDVKTAAARLRQARLGVVAARSQFLPQVNADAGASYLHFSKNAGFSSLASLFGGGASGGGQTGGGSSGGSSSGIALPGGGVTTYSVGFDASWELDLFGGVRRDVEGTIARAEGAEWQLRDIQVSLAAEVANAYLQLRTLQAREAVTRAEIARQTRALQLMQNTARAGLVPEGDYIRQRSGLANAQAELSPLIAEEAIQTHALGVLLGRAPEALVAELATPAALPSAPPAVPAGLPSDLLRRRPDIRAAERELAAATADIGVATADLYPRFSLTGMAQLISTALRNLFDPDSLQISGNARAIFPVLDWGRRRATVKIREAQREEAYLRYQQTVLGALKDVEDALVRIDTERRRTATLRDGVADGERSVQAADARYRSGLTDLSVVLQAQQSVLATRSSLAESDGALRQDLAGLYKALGGGWSVTGEKDR
jgi:NodT family efflux transporter outer membrane factor (OMF) lipoprotein